MQIENYKVKIGGALAVPSRYANPFATCWTRPEAMPFVFPPGVSATRLIVKLAAHCWRGEIIGPHGSGKSTLLETLKPLLAKPRSLSTIALRSGQRSLPLSWLRDSLASSLPLLLIDGYEQLSRPARLGLRMACRQARSGLLVTSHTPTGLPRLMELQPTRSLVDQLVASLISRVPSPVDAADVAAGFEAHGSNVRELLFLLYARHEERSRSGRTADAALA